MTPKEAILATVFRWSYIIANGVDPIKLCVFCVETRERAKREHRRLTCSDCIYTKVFKRPCFADFPEMARGLKDQIIRPRDKLCRALLIARRCGFRAEALDIIREVRGA